MPFNGNSFGPSKRRGFLVFICLVLLVSGVPLRAKRWDRKGAIRTYRQAKKLEAALRAKPISARSPRAYVGVIKKYRQVPLKDPHYGGCDDAIFFMAKLYQEMGELYKLKQYYKWASATYLRVVIQYPSTPYGAKARLAAGRILSTHLKKPKSGANQFRKVISRYPSTSEARAARRLLSPGRRVRAASKHPPPGAKISPPRPARPTSSGVRTLTRTLGLKTGKIVIDPGHGGHDTGTIGRNGLKEKDLALDIALRLRDILEENLDAEVILTRDKDIFLPLEKRTQIANQYKADLFLSIHANYSRNSRVSGVETFVLNFARTAYERGLATRENAASHRTISDLEDLVRKITRQDKLAESKELARFVQRRLQLRMSKQNSSSRNRGVKQAPFVVLAQASMPSILTEVAFLSNPRDAAALKKARTRKAAAEAIYQGVSDYIRSLSTEASVSFRTSN